MQVRDAIGRRWQMCTLQVDLQLPERFDLEYQAADGDSKRPYMIHRALFGSIERFFAILLEHYAGALPPWLSPVQVVGIPIAERHVRLPGRHRRPAAAAGRAGRGRHSDDRMQKKILKAQQQKVPFMLLAGDKDVDAGLVSLRLRDGTERRGMTVDEAVAEILGAIAQPNSSRSRSRASRGSSGDRTEPAAWQGYRPEFDEQAGAGLRDAFARLYTPHRLAYIKRREQADAEGDVDPVLPRSRRAATPTA